MNVIGYTLIQSYLVMPARAGEGVVRERLKNLEISSRLLPSSVAT
jgi:hypothetical protein